MDNEYKIKIKFSDYQSRGVNRFDVFVNVGHETNSIEIFNAERFLSDKIKKHNLKERGSLHVRAGYNNIMVIQQVECSNEINVNDLTKELEDPNSVFFIKSL